MTALAAAPSWRDGARCAETDPEVFFPGKGEPAGAAKLICAGCEVRAGCLAYAVSTGQRYGIWGGMSERDRRRLRGERRAAA